MSISRFLFPLLLLSCLSFKAQSQQQNAERTPFTHRLWYGGGLGLGFSGFNGSSAFGVGVSPMVGYKIIEKVSVGPRLSFFFTSQRVPGYKAFNLFDTELTAFIRIRPYRGFFIQGEIGPGWDQGLYYDVNGNIIRDTERRTNQYVGIGYNFSNGQGGIGQEIAAFYNFAIANDIYSQEQPLSYRLAFTWRF